MKTAIFGSKPNIKMLTTYIRVYLQNQRQGTSSTKTRGEVSGGGKKPWKQKGTGRARAGSTRSPIWVHGGIAHGPRPKDWGLKIQKGARRLALASAVLDKVNSGDLALIEEIKIKGPKTRDLISHLKGIGAVRKGTGRSLLVLADKEDNVLKSSKNISWLNVVCVDNLNAYDIVSAKSVLFEKGAFSKLEKKYK